MVLTIENAGALISGVTIKEDNVAAIRVKVLRGFYDGKTSLKPGDIVTMNSSLARQAKEANKVEFLPDPSPEAKTSKAEPIKDSSAHPGWPKPEIKEEVKAEAKEEIKEDLKKSKKA